MRKEKGFALIITIIITFVMSLTALTMLTIVYRYTSIIKNKKQELQDKITLDNDNYQKVGFTYGNYNIDF